MTDPFANREQQQYRYDPGVDAVDGLPRRRPLWVVVVAVIAIISLVLAGVVAALNFLAVQREPQPAEELEHQQTVEAGAGAESALADPAGRRVGLDPGAVPGSEPWVMLRTLV